jgi:hypothetical protein
VPFSFTGRGYCCVTDVLRPHALETSPHGRLLQSYSRPCGSSPRVIQYRAKAACAVDLVVYACGVRLAGIAPVPSVCSICLPPRFIGY